MSTLAIIPARGGSKGIPKKNIVDVAGKPLIYWSISQALASRHVERTIVSTDCSEIASIAQDCGAEVPFLRPPELSHDTATTESALFHALDMLAAQGYIPDNVLLLQPTCPIRNPGSIDRAVDLLTQSGADSVVGVREIHPFLWQIPEDAKPHYDYLNRPRRQDVAEDDRLYEETGALYLIRHRAMRLSGNRLGGKVALFVMENHESIDIDTPADILIASAILREKLL